MEPDFTRAYGKCLMEDNPDLTLSDVGHEVQDNDVSLFLIYDPVERGKELSIKDIRIYYDKHKGSFNSEDLFKNVLLRIPITTAINDWLNTLENPGTKRKYKRAFERIFQSKPLKDAVEKNCAITTLNKHSGNVGIYRLIEELDAPESEKIVCQSVYSRFCDFLRIATLGIVDPEESPRQKKDYYTTSIIYEDVDWKGFMSKLRTPFNLLAEMTFLAAKSCEYRLRLVNSTKNVLSLDTSQIRFENNTIAFRADQSYLVADILGAPFAIPFPDDFMRRLKAYVGKRSGRVFLSKRGKPLFSMQVQREFKRASKNMPHEITPVMLGWAGVLAFKEDRQN